MNEFIEILNDLILEKNLSLRELAKASNVTAVQYSRYLHGSTPTIEIVIKIAQYFNCSIDYLFGLDKNKTNSKYKTYTYDMSNFLNTYKQLLKANNISHYKFAEMNKFNESIIRHWEKGKIPRLDILYTIASNLSGSIDHLIGRK